MKVYLTEPQVAFVLEAVETWEQRNFRWPLSPGYVHAKEVKHRLLNAVESYERRIKSHARTA